MDQPCPEERTTPNLIQSIMRNLRHFPPKVDRTDEKVSRMIYLAHLPYFDIDLNGDAVQEVRGISSFL